MYNGWLEKGLDQLIVTLYLSILYLYSIYTLSILYLLSVLNQLIRTLFEAHIVFLQILMTKVNNVFVVFLGNSRKGFKRCRHSWVLHYIHYLSIPLYTISWSKFFSRHTLYFFKYWFIKVNNVFVILCSSSKEAHTNCALPPVTLGTYNVSNALKWTILTEKCSFFGQEVLYI